MGMWKHPRVGPPVACGLSVWMCVCVCRRGGLTDLNVSISSCFWSSVSLRLWRLMAMVIQYGVDRVKISANWTLDTIVVGKWRKERRGKWQKEWLLKRWSGWNSQVEVSRGCWVAGVNAAELLGWRSATLEQRERESALQGCSPVPLTRAGGSFLPLCLASNLRVWKAEWTQPRSMRRGPKPRSSVRVLLVLLLSVSSDGLAKPAHVPGLLSLLTRYNHFHYNNYYFPDQTSTHTHIHYETSVTGFSP